MCVLRCVCLLLQYLLQSCWRGLSCVFITAVVCLFTAVPFTKLFAWGEGDSGGHVRFKPLATVCVFITAVPITFFFIRLLLKWGVVNYTVG